MQEDLTKWGSFSNLDDIDDLNSYMQARPLGHGAYYHYTALSSVDAILKSNGFLIGNVKGFNDHTDAKQFEPEQDLYFSLCFTSGDNENLSLWYMYSGMNGDGARIKFTPKKIEKFLDECEYTLFEYENEAAYKANKEAPSFKRKLEKNVDITQHIADILYAENRPKARGFTIKYNTMTNRKFSKEVFEKYKGQNKGLTKGLIWYYEKETRVLLKLSDDFKTILDPQKVYAISMNVNNIIPFISLQFAPEITSLESVLKKKDEKGEFCYPNIREFILRTSKAVLSNHVGELEMKLCDRCDIKKEFNRTCKCTQKENANEKA